MEDVRRLGCFAVRRFEITDSHAISPSCGMVVASGEAQGFAEIVRAEPAHCGDAGYFVSIDGAKAHGRQSFSAMVRGLAA